MALTQQSLPPRRETSVLPPPLPHPPVNGRVLGITAREKRQQEQIAQLEMELRAQQELQRQQDIELRRHQEALQQQQFEQNVQSIFGIGQGPGVAVDGSDPAARVVGGAYALAAEEGPSDVDINTPAFFTALRVNVLAFIVLVVAYELFRRFFPSVYSARGARARSPSTPRSTAPPLSPLAPPPSTPAVNVDTRRFLGWVPGVVRAPWSAVRATGGLDAYLFLRYVRLCFRIAATSALWGMTLLWPVYATGDGGADGWYFLSMANLSQGSQRLWVPTVFLWLQTMYVIFAMSEEYQHYLECRINYLARQGRVASQQHMYSLLVERIPHELRSNRALYEYFNRLFPSRVHSAAVVLNLPDLEAVSARRRRVVRRLEKSLVSLEVKGRRPQHVVGRKRLRCCGIESYPLVSFGGNNNGTDNVSLSERMPERGEKIDSINYYSRELTVMNERLARMQYEKIELAQRGNDSARASEWISNAVGRMSAIAGSAFGPANPPDDAPSPGSAAPTRRRKPLLMVILDRLGIDFISGAVRYVQQNIDEVVDSVVGATMSSTGFITFKDLSTLACAVKTPLFPTPDVLVVRVAPEPSDLIWENVHVNLGWSRGREWTANVLLGLGALLWSVPVATIQALAAAIDIDSAADQIAAVPGMGWAATLNGGHLANLVNGYLPVVLLLTIIMILPHIFYVVALKYEDRKTLSDVQASIIGRYFYYQLANIFITVTAGSILDSLGEIIEHPGSILAILGKSLPNVVGYFATFIMTKIFAGLPLTLLRVPALLRMVFIKICFREKYLTQEELDEANYPRKYSQLWYGWEYPNLLLVIVICFVYSCISPIILPVGAVFFLGSWLVYKNHILIVYNPIYESGGTMFPMACHRTLIGLVCGQLTLIGYSIMRFGFYQALTMFPLPLITVKMMDVFRKLYVVPGMCISVEQAVELDAAQKHVQSSFSPDVYRQPVLTEKIAEPQVRQKPVTGSIMLELVDEAKVADSGKIV